MNQFDRFSRARGAQRSARPAARPLGERAFKMHTQRENLPGMGFSHGYNRAEHIDHYKTGRELIMVLVDLVC